MNPNAKKATVAALGPLLGDLPLTGTAPLGASNASAQGVLNLSALGTTPVLVIQGGLNLGKQRKIKIVVVSAGKHIAWDHVSKGNAAPATMTALGAGAATEGSLLMNGGGATEELSILDNMDFYIVASAAGTVVNITVEEV